MTALKQVTSYAIYVPSVTGKVPGCTSSICALSQPCLVLLSSLNPCVPHSVQQFEDKENRDSDWENGTTILI